MKLVFLNENIASAIRAWNSDDTAESLRDQGIDCESRTINGTEWKSDGDVFIFYRTMTMNSFFTMQEIQRVRGKPCGFMIDDLVWDPRFSYAYSEDQDRISKRFFESADFFVFTSDRLADIARKVIPKGKPIFHRRPGILERRFQDLRRLSDRARPLYFPKDQLRILISKGHITDDFKSLIRIIFQELDLFEAQVYYFSVEELFPDLGKRVGVHRLNPCDFDRYLREIAKIAPDIVLCPLSKNEFNDCKCYPKYLEAGGLGSALLVSDVFPYKQIIEQGGNGILAESNSEFASLLQFAAKNRTWLSTVGQNARGEVECNHLLGPIALEFYQRLKEKYGNQS